ncbi:hypothetical protein ACFFMP_14055 [Pseudoroseomonas cervicalis]|uniref:hypothetical protein n=1 Tax=Teichococcus cervicalis TaxID=204525 RepID=UPI0035E8B7D6
MPPRFVVTARRIGRDSVSPASTARLEAPALPRAPTKRAVLRLAPPTPASPTTSSASMVLL